jgi:hypothetical protein
MRTFNFYSLRDEREKYFQQIKSQMLFDRQRNWSEEGNAGRHLILFVSLILSSYLRHIWESTSLHEEFLSPLDVLDVMRSIQCIKNNNKIEIITPFWGAQLDVCKAFGFEVPEDRAPTSMSSPKSPKSK